MKVENKFLQQQQKEPREEDAGGSKALVEKD